MSFYVKRSDPTHPGSWTGPLPSLQRATREAEAWRSAGWSAEVIESTPAARAEVQAWVKAKDKAAQR